MEDNAKLAAVPQDDLDNSFDLVARADAVDATIGALRGEVAEVKSRLDRVSRDAARPMIGGGAAATPGLEMKGFVQTYLRAGRETELKSMSIGSATDGGYLVPTELDAQIAQRMLRFSPIRSIAQVVQTATTDYRKLVAVSGAASGWVSEGVARPGSNAPRFAEIVPPYGELYANPSATQTMLDDVGFDLAAWLAEQIAREFARAEGAAFIAGSGIGQPVGFVTGPTSVLDDSTRGFGTLQYLPSGDGAAFDANPDLHLIDMVTALNPGHRQTATWVMNSRTLGMVRKLKDADGAFLWQASLTDGAPDRLLGYPVVEAGDMPDVAGGNYPIAFGNFNAGYLITERMGTRILRDPYTNKPFVNFYATRRVGGQVLDSDAIKLMKIAVS